MRLACMRRMLRYDRLLAMKDLDHGLIFATPHPTLNDYLPSNQNTLLTDIPGPRLLGVAVQGISELADISFPDVAAYPAMVQACYLLGRVLNYIRSNTLSPEQKEKESSFLDQTIQAFARSLLRQAAGSTLQGHYCTPFFLCLMSVCRKPTSMTRLISIVPW
jgi:hypothetical protein